MQTADASDVRLAIQEGKLRVTDSGVFWGRRPNPKAVWRLRALGKRKSNRGTYYHYVTFTNSTGRFGTLAHRVVWFAHKGEIPEGLTINHINGIKTDNRLTNLELMTQKEQLAHAIALGLFDPHTPKNWSLTPETVRLIRERLSWGEPQAQVARDLELNTNVVNRIACRKTYRSVA